MNPATRRTARDTHRKEEAVYEQEAEALKQEDFTAPARGIARPDQDRGRQAGHSTNHH